MGRPIIIKDSYRIFDEIDSEETAYWLGFIYADGMVRPKGYEVALNLGTKDLDHLIKFANLFGARIVKRSTFSKKQRKTYETFCCSVYSKYLYDSLVSKGIYPRKTYLKDSDILDYIPDYLFHHFIRGVFDGDGTIIVPPNDAYCYFSLLGCEALLIKIRDYMVENLAISSNIIEARSGIFRVAWQGRFQLLKIREWLYGDTAIYLQRKYDRFSSIQDRELTSSFRGVCLHKGRWMAHIGYGGEQYYLGSFSNEEEAAKAYDLAAMEHRGEDARLNFLRPS